MTERFTPDPGSLQDRLQAAMGDRLIHQVPGYDPGQVLPVLVIPPTDAAPLPVKVVSAGRSAEWTGWTQSAAGVFTPPDGYQVANGDEFDCRAQHVPGGSDPGTYWEVQGRPGNPRVPWLPGLPTPGPTPANPLGFMFTNGLEIGSWSWVMSGRTDEWTGVVVATSSTNGGWFATRRLTGL